MTCVPAPNGSLVEHMTELNEEREGKEDISLSSHLRVEVMRRRQYKVPSSCVNKLVKGENEGGYASAPPFAWLSLSTFTGLEPGLFK